MKNPSGVKIYRITIRQIKKAPEERHVFYANICRSSGALGCKHLFFPINISLLRSFQENYPF